MDPLAVDDEPDPLDVDDEPDFSMDGNRRTSSFYESLRELGGHRILLGGHHHNHHPVVTTTTTSSDKNNGSCNDKEDENDLTPPPSMEVEDDDDDDESSFSFLNSIFHADEHGQYDRRRCFYDDDDTKDENGGGRINNLLNDDDGEDNDTGRMMALNDLDFDPQKRSLFRNWKKCWQLVVAFFAFLDCYSSLLAYNYYAYSSSSSSPSSLSEKELLKQQDHQSHSHHSRDHHPPQLQLSSNPINLQQQSLHFFPLMVLQLHQWLVRHGNLLAFLFSFVWFIDAFVLARRQKCRVLHKLDSKRLLLGKQEVEQKMFQARIIYVLSLLVQLLLLPTGFYLYLWHHVMIVDHILPCFSTTTMIVKGKILFFWHQSKNDGTTSSSSSSSLLSSSSSSSSLNSMCLAVYVIQTLAVHCTHRSHEYIHHMIKTYIWDYIWRNIWKPFKLHRRVRSILRTIRWAHYLGPLGGTAGKFHRVWHDIQTVQRQRQRALQAKKERQSIQESMSYKDLQTMSAIKIQAAYRSRMARKYRYAIALIRGDTMKLSNVFVQSTLRRSFRQGLSIAANRHERLKALEDKSQQLRCHKRQLSFDERESMYQLRQELQGEASRLLNERLLLRPDSKFITVWQNIFVLAVLVEIAGLAIIPNLSENTNRHGKGGPPPIINMVALLRRKLLPTPASELCAIWLDEQGRHDSPLTQVLEWFVDLFKPTGPVTAAPWHCDPIYETVQHIYIVVVGFLINRAIGIVSFMFFLDVFVHFFTGRIHPDTGRLVPRGFFERWFFPGLFLELALNPYMERTADLIQSLVANVVRKDPVRVLRWSVALFYPLAMVLAPIIRRLWCMFTIRMNKGKSVLGGEPDSALDTHRRASFVRAITNTADMKTTTARSSLLGSPSTGNLLLI